WLDKLLDFRFILHVYAFEIFEDLLKAASLKITKPNGLTYLNIFAVIRTVPYFLERYKSNFDYTASIILFSEMKDNLREWCKKSQVSKLRGRVDHCPLSSSDVEQCLSALEQPLGKNSRSVSDLVFSSGIVDFGRKANEKYWDTSVAGDHYDQQRRRIEQCIYPAEQQLFYIPIHVGGTPWLALYTFTPKSPDTDLRAWHHNYIFYRDVVQKSATLIRQKSHEAYSNLTANYLVNHMKSWVAPIETVVSRINRDAQKLSQIYPFPLVTFSEGQHSSDNDIFVPGRGSVAINFSPNPFFRRQVSWKTGDQESIIKHCRKAIGDFRKTEASIEINAVAQSSHLIKVPLRTLSSIASSDHSNNPSVLQRQIRKILDLHDVASALISEKKREEFRRRHRSECSFGEFTNLFQDQYFASTRYLVINTVSGNRSEKLSRMIKGKNILFSSQLPDSIDKKIFFYKPHIQSMFDGLLTNAIKAINSSNPSILVQLILAKGKHIILSVENSTDKHRVGLNKLVCHLNSPSPDMVGVTELHWIAKACWPYNADSRLFWTVLDTPCRIAAQAQIAEVVI
ncbi:MAG: hypothetical protein D3910_03440, partial [Candidatus Electrothrix sp. ATG2]|nr:hypothetical protein [Candidatus Electrothrix sp. ATG2]